MGSRIKYKGTRSPKKVPFTSVIRLHRLVFKLTLRVGQLEDRIKRQEERWRETESRYDGAIAR